MQQLTNRQIETVAGVAEQMRHGVLASQGYDADRFSVAAMKALALGAATNRAMICAMRMSLVKPVVVHHPSFGIGMARQDRRQQRQNFITVTVHRKAESLGLCELDTYAVNRAAHTVFNTTGSVARALSQAHMMIRQLGETA